MDRKEINSEMTEDSIAYVVYVDHEDEKIFPLDIDYYRKPKDALKRANKIKDSFLNDNNWCIEDEADAAEITVPDTDITFYHKDSQSEACISVHPITLK